MVLMVVRSLLILWKAAERICYWMRISVGVGEAVAGVGRKDGSDPTYEKF